MGLFPFTLIPLVLYIFAGLFLYQEPLVAPNAGDPNVIPFWSNTVVDVTLVSGQEWTLSYSDLLVAFAILLMLFSILRTASTNRMTVLGNMVMVLVLCVYIVMFLTVEFAGTSTFFLLTMVALIDTLSTVSISLVASHSTVDAVPD
ncbi:hypothetical protein [Acuticoccus yangtzensis]|uniref:hypothetical protein n=1 Tax=Acuticoccus yangtzensis TaxID=1443441 RepID=UPI00094954B7|nr:hypothetical protein [Acuticoccus yangtzensis]ORE93088.1 transmembrane protein [Stappia sp. 22II-S9-Z10]